MYTSSNKRFWDWGVKVVAVAYAVAILVVVAWSISDAHGRSRPASPTASEPQK